MADFKNGGVPYPDYDSDDINYIDQKTEITEDLFVYGNSCLLYTSPSPRDYAASRMPSSA